METLVKLKSKRRYFYSILFYSILFYSILLCLGACTKEGNEYVAPESRNYFVREGVLHIRGAIILPYLIRSHGSTMHRSNDGNK